MHDFFKDTYETAVTRPSPRTPRRNPASDRSDTDDTDDSAAPTHPHRRTGRPSHVRANYKATHPNAEHKLCVTHSPLHRNIVNYVGRFFPSAKDMTTYPFYCASMLALLKPWRNLGADLKTAGQTWEEAFKEFMDVADSHIHRIVAGIEYYHDCRLAARDQVNEDLPLDNRQPSDVMRGIDDMELGEAVPEGHNQVSEEARADVLS